MMEKRKQRIVGNEISLKRSPLQDLNRIPLQKPNTKKSSNLSSSSSSIDVSSEAQKGCLRFLLSSNSCSSSSSANHSNTFSKIGKKYEPQKSTADRLTKALARSKENEVAKKPFLQKSRRNQSQRLTQKQKAKDNGKPIFKNAQRSKLSSIRSNPMNEWKKGPENFRTKLKNSQDSSGNSIFAEKSTPLGEITSGCGLDFVIENTIYERDNCCSAAASKTPPLEVSLSPEIQCQSNSKIPVLNSEATPVCYGAGHLVSGVTDKRKCRRRGSLKGGFEKVNLFDDKKENENVMIYSDFKDSPVPLPAEASVRWLLSPCKEGKSDSTSRCNYSSSPLDLCGHESSYLLSGESSYTSGSSGNLANKMRNSGNIVQTPNSEVDLITETLKRVRLSHMSEIPMWDTTPAGPTENIDSISSWPYDNLALSRVRISWRDGLVSRIDENDDCCCCLSDQEIDADGSGEKNQENDLRMDNDLCPMVLDYVPCISARGKEKLVSNGANACQESICTNGGGLVASDDSDWIYCHENRLFEVK